MNKSFFLSMLAASSISMAGGLYNDTYMQRSGVVAAPVETGLPNHVDGRQLLHWHRYVVRLAPVVFQGTEVVDASEGTIDQLEKLIRQNRSKIRYVSLIGHSSAVVDEENRMDLDGWSGLWQGLGGDPRLKKPQAVRLVNERLRYLYRVVRDAGMPASRIFSENRLDRQLLYTEATAAGRLGNNRVDVALYSTGPLSLADLRIQFALDSDRILPQFETRVADFARLLKQNPGLSTTIVGHTDRRGSYAYNITLSKRRAEAVKARLVELGVSPDRIRTEGRGYTQPLVSGHSEAAYRQNRRIEAKLYR